MNKLAQNFTFGGLVKFALPSISMMVCMSLYFMVDGIFVARLIGTDALSAINIVFPLINLIVGVGIMLATGGNAIVARNMGQCQLLEANRNFTLLTIAGVITGTVLALLGLLFLHPILGFLGAEGAIFDYSYNYVVTLTWFFPLAILQILFQSFLITAGRPVIGMVLIIIAGGTNVVLDYIFIAVFNMGIAGAALATGIGYCIPALAGLIYFGLKLNHNMYFVKPRWNSRVILSACINGSSEMVASLSGALITFLFNIIMLHYIGPSGVAAITITLYLEYLLVSIFLGYSLGVSPIISYNYGSQNICRLKWLFKNSLAFVSISAVIIFLVANLFTEKIAGIFAPSGSEVFDLTVNGFYIFSFCFLFMGVNIFGSALFTALSNGKISACIAFMRSFIFIAIGIILWPKLFGIAGIWLAVPVGEILSLLLTLMFFWLQKKVYQYV